MSERWIAWVKYRRDRLFLQRIAWTIILKRARVTHWPVAYKAMRKAFDRWRYLMGLSAVILVVGLACRLVNLVAFDNQPALRFLGHFVKTLGNFLELLGRIARESRVGVALKPGQTLHAICVSEAYSYYYAEALRAKTVVEFSVSLMLAAILVRASSPVSAYA
jgi:hypothetical protein